MIETQSAKFSQGPDRGTLTGSCISLALFESPPCAIVDFDALELHVDP